MKRARPEGGLAGGICGAMPCGGGLVFGQAGFAIEVHAGHIRADTATLPSWLRAAGASVTAPSSSEIQIEIENERPGQLPLTLAADLCNLGSGR